MRFVTRTLLLPLVLAGLLSGCSDQRSDLTPFAQSTIVGVGYEIYKARVERRLGMTCNLENIVIEGSYCVSNYKPTDRQEVFCFKTLGGVDCYAEPDPYSLEGRQLPGPPRALADPRMPMTPPGRRPEPQLATMPYEIPGSMPTYPDSAPPPAAQPQPPLLMGPSPATGIIITEPAPDPATRPM
jgi:hypothetical protein